MATESPLLVLKSGEYELKPLLDHAKACDREDFDVAARCLGIRAEEIETAWIYTRAVVRDRGRIEGQ